MKCTGAVLLLIMICIVSAGCGSASKWKYDPITDLNDLEGRRVGVNLSWEADYYLNGRKDLKLVRYDTSADLVMALKYDKIDVIATDEDMVRLLMSSSTGLEVVEPAFAKIGSIMYFGSDDEALAEDFNKFLAEFKKTDEYKDFVKRQKEFNGQDYIGPDIPLTGTGKTLRISADPNNFPRIVKNPGEDDLTGFDLEILKHYANDRNYKLEIAESNYNDGVMGLQSGNYDILTGYVSDVYGDEVKNIGLYVCDPMFYFDLYYIQKNQADITAVTDYLD